MHEKNIQKYILGTSALNLYEGHTPRNTIMQMDLSVNRTAQAKSRSEQVRIFFQLLHGSFIAFLAHDRLNKGLGYDNFAGQNFNKMTKGQAIGTGILFMTIALAAVFLGI